VRATTAAIVAVLTCVTAGLSSPVFVSVRRAYWQAAEGGEPRKVAQMLIVRLEF
jgi:hypothetical protein